MTSELWQRLRAARRYADKRQQDISDACGVSRGSVAEAHTFEILVGHLLLLERAAGRTTNKHLLLWQRPAEYKADDQAVTAIATYLRSTFGVNMEVVESPAAAGAYLVKAAND